MITIEHSFEEIQEKDFSSTPPKQYPILFLGFVIKNQYDNMRIELNSKYNPVKFYHVLKSGVIPLNGIVLTPNDNLKKVIESITNQEKSNNMNLVIYENLISQFNFSCKETYGYFQKGIYPLDFNNLKSVCDDDFNLDKKIFQHLLCIDDSIFDFQKFAALKLFILT